MTVLDTIRRLLGAAGHPDMTRVELFDGAQRGVQVVYRSQAKAFVWVVERKVATKPADFPEQMPDYKTRVMHLLRLIVDLLEQVRPAGVEAWRTVSVEGVALEPCGLQVRAGGETVLLRVTAGGAPGEDTDPATFADWRIPARITI